MILIWFDYLLAINTAAVFSSYHINTRELKWANYQSSTNMFVHVHVLFV